MSYSTFPNGLTYEEYAVVSTILTHPNWSYPEVRWSVEPESSRNRRTASKKIQDILDRPRVKAALEAEQRRQQEAVGRDIDEVDKREFGRATAAITDVLTPEGDLLPPSEWPERARGAVESYSVRMVGTLGKDGLPILEKRVKMWSPTTSARLVYERRGLLKPDQKPGDTYNFTKQEVLVIGLLGDSEARRALDVLAERLEGQSGSNGG